MSGIPTSTTSCKYPEGTPLYKDGTWYYIVLREKGKGRGCGYVQENTSGVFLGRGGLAGLRETQAGETDPPAVGRMVTGLALQLNKANKAKREYQQQKDALEREVLKYKGVCKSQEATASAQKNAVEQVIEFWGQFAQCKMDLKACEETKGAEVEAVQKQLAGFKKANQQLLSLQAKNAEVVQKLQKKLEGQREKAGGQRRIHVAEPPSTPGPIRSATKQKRGRFDPYEETGGVSMLQTIAMQQQQSARDINQYNRLLAKRHAKEREAASLFWPTVGSAMLRSQM